ncbi:hypothetical protein FACUT_13254 [Fusarium acutatum]|uniref:Uncharacterized protein n=1 Tax=Fusarium acutatum TaxID=78861 RepID=A0A8H4J9L5_9HYPO|nr:hypothetical protein FACUT_13254 [Fusarium acutatum]
MKGSRQLPNDVVPLRKAADISDDEDATISPAAGVENKTNLNTDIVISTKLSYDLHDKKYWIQELAAELTVQEALQAGPWPSSFEPHTLHCAALHAIGFQAVGYVLEEDVNYEDRFADRDPGAHGYSRAYGYSAIATEQVANVRGYYSTPHGFPTEEVQQWVKECVDKSTQDPPSSPAWEADPPVYTAGPPALLANDQSLTEIFLMPISPRKLTSVVLSKLHDYVEKWLEKTTEPEVVFVSTSESTLAMGSTGASFYVADL